MEIFINESVRLGQALSRFNVEALKRTKTINGYTYFHAEFADICF